MPKKSVCFVPEVAGFGEYAFPPADGFMVAGGLYGCKVEFDAGFRDAGKLSLLKGVLPAVDAICELADEMPDFAEL